LDTQAVDEVIDWFCRKLEESGIRVTMIVLFGSYAKNRISQHSDIDLAVITPDFENVHILDRIPMVSEAEWSTVRKFNVPLDLILLTQEEYEQENSIRMTFVKQGKCIPDHA
jgi:predicted nucleotidyltransferase